MRNVNRSKKHEEMVQLLAIRQHPTTSRSLFPTIRELMCFAAMLGYAQKRREPLDRKLGVEDIASAQFDANNSSDYIFLTGLAEHRSLDALKDGHEDDAVAIFEEYANGGLEIIQEWMRATPDDPFGDRAILAGLARDGFMASAKDEQGEKGEIGDVTF